MANWLVVLLLAALSLVFLLEGMVFIGFVFLVLLVLALAAGYGGSAQGARYTRSADPNYPGIIIENEEPDIPSNIDIKIKPNWEANTLFEDMFAGNGEMLDTLGRSTASFITGGQYGKPRKEKEGKTYSP